MQCYKVLHKFIVYLADLLQLEDVHDLVTYANCWKLHEPPSSFSVTSSEEKCLIELSKQLHPEFANDCDATTVASPPQSVSELFHWYTLGGLVSKLPEQKQTLVCVYQPYKATNILTVRGQKCYMYIKWIALHILN